MAADQQQLALEYLLTLSSDIRSAVLLGDDGRLLAAAPASAGAPDGAPDLLGAALELRGDSGESLELDIVLDRVTVYLLARDGLAIACVADRQSLPGIVLHEMRAVLGDIGTERQRTLGRAEA